MRLIWMRFAEGSSGGFWLDPSCFRNSWLPVSMPCSIIGRSHDESPMTGGFGVRQNLLEGLAEPGRYFSDWQMGVL